jgi:hypothetical protein
MAVKSYNPKKVLVSWGEVLFSGFADGEFINAARNNQSVNLAVGSTGAGARAISNDKSGTITVTLLQSSLTNAQLSAAAIADEAGLDGGVKPFLIKDLSGVDLVKAETAWLQQPAAAPYAREISNREWVFETDALEILVGGIP